MTYPDYDLADLLNLAGIDPADLDLTGTDLAGYICYDPTCVDGNVPADQFAAYGQLYQPCPCCQPNSCGDCGGMAAFPAERGYLDYLIEQLLAAGLRAVLCPGCGGLLDITDLALNTGVIP
jgi:hypothetical protein